MNHTNLPVDLFIPFFEENLSGLAENYKWRIGSKAQDAAIDFLPNFKWAEESGGYEECVRLKHELTGIWARAQESKKPLLANWIVSSWGGVRANRTETIDAHLSWIMRNEEPNSLAGVASYSKILSVVNCRKYAIYDARVAACLNAIQLQNKSQGSVYFHYVPSRNNIIKEFVKHYSPDDLTTMGWHVLDKKETYSFYLKLIHEIKMRLTAKHPDIEVYDIEMLLFSKAPELCGKTIEDFGSLLQ